MLEAGGYPPVHDPRWLKRWRWCSAGAGSAGGPSSPQWNHRDGGKGGLGVRVSIAGSPYDPSPIGAPGPGSGAAATGWFAGGGGGGGSNGPTAGGGWW